MFGHLSLIYRLVLGVLAQELVCAPIEDSNHYAHPRSLIRRLIGVLWITKGSTFLQSKHEDSDQTVWVSQSYQHICCKRMPICTLSLIT